MKKNIKILHIITRLIQGGAQKSVLLTAEYLAKRGFDVYLVSGPTSGPEGQVSLDEIKDRVKIHIIPELIREINLIKDLIVLVKLYIFIRRNNFDIVHTHTSKAGILGRLAARLAKTPVIIHTPHGHFFYGHFGFVKTRFFILLEKIMSVFADKIITLTEIEKNEHIKFGIGREEKFAVISDGIEINKFINRGIDSEDVREEFGIPAPAPVIGMVARLVAVKGHRYLLDAFKIIVKKRSDARLLIVGDGILKDDLKRYCKNAGIADSVIFTGLRYDIAHILHMLDVVALPSLNEGLGIALLEAMAMRKPVVASNIAGIPEIVEDGVVGYLAPPRDSVSLADKILKIIENPQMARAMGENGFKKIIASFSISVKIDELEKLYQDLLEAKFVIKSGKIRVLHIITRLIVGGAQENTISTIAGLDKDKYWIMLTSGPTSGPEGNMEAVVKKNDILLVKIPELVREINIFKDIAAFFKLYKLIKRYRFDIVHTHTSKAGILGRCAAYLAGCPVIIHTPHGHLFYGYYGKFKTGCFILLERAISRISTCIVALTETDKKEHVDFNIAGPEKFRVIQSGIDIEAFLNRDRNKLDELRKKLGLSPDKKLVGTIARLVPIKGHSYFIEAAEKVVKEVPQARFMIIGDGVLRTNLEDLVRKKNLSGYFYFLGLRNDVADLLALFNVVVLSSLNEGMGRVIVEAMALTKPVVATNVGGVPDVVVDGYTGLLVKPRDKDALAESIITLLKDECRARSMGEAGMRRAKDIFSKDDMIRKIDNMYNEFLAG